MTKEHQITIKMCIKNQTELPGKKTSIEIIADESQLHKELVNWKI